MLNINKHISIPVREFDFRFSRSPGPGGQNVNKLNTKVTLRWKIQSSNQLPDAVKQRFVKKFAKRISKEGILSVTSHRYRDQGRNVADCLSKLREMILTVATAPKPRKKTKPSKASKIRRLESKRRQSDKKKNRQDPTA